MTAKAEPILEMSEVKKYFPVKSSFLKKTISNVQAVENVTVEVMEGETLGIVGESGCGKSTLGRTILGLEKLTAGSIKFRGEEIGGLSERQFKKYKKEMQMIFQDPYASLNPRQRIGDALEEAFIIHTPISRKERRQRVKDFLWKWG